MKWSDLEFRYEHFAKLFCSPVLFYFAFLYLRAFCDDTFFDWVPYVIAGLCFTGGLIFLVDAFFIIKPSLHRHWPEMILTLRERITWTAIIAVEYVIAIYLFFFVL